LQAWGLKLKPVGKHFKTFSLPPHIQECQIVPNPNMKIHIINANW